LLFTMKIATRTCEPSARAVVMGFATLNPSYELLRATGPPPRAARQPRRRLFCGPRF
jgi:hypothetical protein